ncbi:MarR family winged helix-turn-helix transcriptional regulator [Paenibacillus senegalimassiliensis]|uniref:MarR family winged helix-turn-helix transcriptional regulator n=1 Tax=Paenibacillus senegalimassiliensis TaxID=1737426 RepID=UPI00073EC578|nr:MarR family winged helix-turn-helix transcriptional regulator [Paenibacillus senegalimassiliensis]
MIETPISNLIRSITHKMMMDSEERMKNLEVNNQQGRMICYIHDHQDQGLIQKDLAEAFRRRGASITSMLQGLERKGYIERKIPADNERQKNIYVLPKGERIVAEIGEHFQATEANLTQALTEQERKEFMRLLSKIDQTM